MMHICLWLEYQGTSTLTTTLWIKIITNTEESLLQHSFLLGAFLLRSQFVTHSPAFRHWHFEAKLGWQYLFCTSTSIPLSGMRSLQGNASGVMECWYTRAVKLPVVRKVTRHAQLTSWTTRTHKLYSLSSILYTKGPFCFPLKISWDLSQDLELINHNHMLPFPLKYT